MLQPVNLSSRINSTTQQLLQCRRTWRRTKTGEKVEQEPIVIRCADCRRYKVVNPSCGLRNCDRCMLKRSKKLERRYLPLIRQFQNKRYMRWSFVTLEGVRISGEENLRQNLKRFMDCATKFLNKEYPEGGITVLEHTPKAVIRPLADIHSEGEFLGMGFDGPCTLVRYEKGVYVHAHAIVYGGFKDIPSFARRWRQTLLAAGLVTKEHDPLGGMHGVNMSQVRNLGAAVRYALKYVAKGVQLDDEQVEVLTRLKYIRSWGILYGKELTYDMICMDCEGKCYVDFGALPIEPEEHERLRIKMVERPP